MQYLFYPDKAQYHPQDEIQLLLKHYGELSGKNAHLDLKRMNQTIREINQLITNETITIFKVPPFCQDTFAAYGADLNIQISDEQDLHLSTAFDVVLNPLKVLRYGFLSNFDTQDAGEQDIEWMNRLHLNIVQFYDWSYRHDCLIAPEPRYTDMMGKRIDSSVVGKKIAACHAHNMRALGYGAIYAASEQFYREHPEWALHTSSGDPLVFIDTFYLMNVEQGCPWHDHIINEYIKAVRDAGFDGIHMDTYGFPKTAFTKEGKLLHLEEHYPPLINDTRKAISEAQKKPTLIFNNVGNWPVGEVARANQDAVYIEVWEPNGCYGHLQKIILNAKQECRGGKQVILAAYLAPFRLDTPDRALNSLRFLLAGCAANGATNLLFGEENGVLTQGYYVDHSKLEDKQNAVVQAYCDFLVRYEELLFDSELVDVTATHIGWDNTEYRCKEHDWTPDGKPERLWLTVREKEFLKVISIINLCGITDDFWNTGKDSPLSQTDILFRVQLDHPPDGVFVASPDLGCSASEVEYDLLKTERGMAIEFTVPGVEYWDLVFIRLKKESFT